MNQRRAHRLFIYTEPRSAGRPSKPRFSRRSKQFRAIAVRQVGGDVEAPMGVIVKKERYVGVPLAVHTGSVILFEARTLTSPSVIGVLMASSFSWFTATSMRVCVRKVCLVSE
jgi:hypothetical protein